MIIGITGGIGSGKSRVARFWARTFHLPLVDLDRICRELMEKNNPGWLALKGRFQDRFFKPDGTLDRAALRQAVFTDNTLRAELDNLIHPLAAKVMKEEVAGQDERILLAEIPLLFEAGWQNQVDRVVVVVAETAVRCLRITARDGGSRKQSMQAINAQSSLYRKALQADHVIENHGCWAETSLQVLHLARLYAEKR